MKIIPNCRLSFLIILPILLLTLPALAQEWRGPVLVNSSGTTDTFNQDEVAPSLVWTGGDNYACGYVSSKLLLWTDNYNMTLSVSSDGGASWGNMITLVDKNRYIYFDDYGNLVTLTRHSRDANPCLAASGNTVMAVWNSNDTMKYPAVQPEGVPIVGADNDILWAISHDGGRTWSMARPLNSYSHEDSEATGNLDEDINPWIASDGKGGWVAVWEHDGPYGSGRAGSVKDIYASYFNGANWSPAKRISSALQTSDNRRPRVFTNGKGRWIATWESNFDPPYDYDFTFCTSADGENWSAFKPMFANAAKYNGEDTKLQLATNGLGRWVAIWQSSATLGYLITGMHIFTAYSVNEGESWSSPHPLNTLIEGGAIGYPEESASIATDAKGNFVAVWAINDDDTNQTLLLNAHSWDGGKTWSNPDLCFAQDVEAGKTSLASDGANHWLFVWDYRDMSIGTIGDDDILCGYRDWNIQPPPIVSILNPPANEILDYTISRVGFAGIVESPLEISSVKYRVNLGEWKPVQGTKNWELDLGGLETGLSKVEIKAEDVEGIESLFPNPFRKIYRYSVKGDWARPSPLNGNADRDRKVVFAEDRQPWIAASRFNVWVSVFYSDNPMNGTVGKDTDIFFSVSTDDGATWEDPLPLNSHADKDNEEDGNDPASDEYPRIATGDGTWICVWESHYDWQGKAGKDSDIFFARSRSAGKTWSEAAPLNTNAVSDGDAIDNNAQIIYYGGGVWIVVWSSGYGTGPTGGDYDILYSYSTDDGISWSPPLPVNSHAYKDASDDTYPTIATDGNQVLVAWTTRYNINGAIGTEGDPVVAYLEDIPFKWSDPVVVKSTAGSDKNNDMRPVIATDSKGTWIVIWNGFDDLGGTVGKDGDIYFARSTDDGKTWSDVAALNPNAPIDSGFDTWQWLAADKSGNWVAVWQSNDPLFNTIGEDYDILECISKDGGKTWTVPSMLNKNAAADEGDVDELPHIATDNLGNWVAAWQSTSSLDGFIDIDCDILYAVKKMNLLPSLEITDPPFDVAVLYPTTEYRFDGIASDPDGSIDLVEYNVNKSGWLAANGTDQWMILSLPLAEGENTIEVRARDNEMTLTEVQSRTITRLSETAGKIAPVVQIHIPQEGSVLDFGTTQTQSLGIASDVDGTVARVVARLNHGRWMTADGTTSWTQTLEGIVDGDNLIEARATDDEGIQSAIDSKRIHRRNFRQQVAAYIIKAAALKADDLLAADANKDGIIDVADLVYLLLH